MGNLDFFGIPASHQTLFALSRGGKGGQMQIYFISTIFFNLIDVNVALTGLVL